MNKMVNNMYCITGNIPKKEKEAFENYCNKYGIRQSHLIRMMAMSCVTNDYLRSINEEYSIKNEFNTFIKLKTKNNTYLHNENAKLKQQVKTLENQINQIKQITE